VSFSYLVYGLNLLSDVSIPGLLKFSGNHTNLTLTLGGQPDWLPHALALPASELLTRPSEDEFGEPAFVISELGGGEYFRLSYSDGTCFLVDRDASHLWGRYLPPQVFEDLITYLLGPVLGFVLRRRGVLTLHASSAAIGGCAIALSGISEAGKSTVAGALALRGVKILCEDVCPITEENSQYFVEPGYPRVCLWPDAVQKLLGTPEALPLLTPNWEKRFLSLDDGSGRFATRRLPLAAVYLLAPRTNEPDAPRIESLSPQVAFLEIVKNTYMNFVLDRAQRAAEFDVLSKLVMRVPARRLVPHADPARLGALCDLVLRDAGSLVDDSAVHISTQKGE
jgi:hypothetical protein